MKATTRYTIAALCAGMLFSAAAPAKVSEEEAAKLGAELTPLGAIRAASEDGVIPAWEGGITQPPAGYKPGDHHPDPYPDDQVLFVIDANNVKDYEHLLSPGQIAIFKRYPATWKMPLLSTGMYGPNKCLHRSPSNWKRKARANASSLSSRRFFLKNQ